MLADRMCVIYREYKKYNNAKDIAIKPAAGLRPKKLKLEDVGPDPPCEWAQIAPTELQLSSSTHLKTLIPAARAPNAAFKLLSSKELATAELNSSKQVRLLTMLLLTFPFFDFSMTQMSRNLAESV